MRYVLLGLLVTVGCASAPPTPVAPRQPQRVLPPAPAKAPMRSLLTSEVAAGLSPESLQRMHELLMAEQMEDATGTEQLQLH